MSQKSYSIIFGFGNKKLTLFAFLSSTDDDTDIFGPKFKKNCKINFDFLSFTNKPKFNFFAT